MRPYTPPVFQMTINLSTTGTRLVDSIELKNLGIINSRTSLHRYLHREPNRNPFPQPMRHTVTGRRYWLEADVARWKEREDRRRRITLEDPHLTTDSDPKAWMPKGARQAAASTIVAPMAMVSGPGDI
jgi:hypothetical protein